jgi:WD40 repeat protein
LRILDLSTGKDIFPQVGSQAPVAKVHFLPDGNSLGTTSEDGSCRICETATGKEIRAIGAPIEEEAMAVDLTTAGQKYAVGLMTNQINICDATTGKTLHRLDGNKTGFSAFAFSPDGKVLAAREMVSPLIHVYDTTTGKAVRRLEAPPGGVAANQNMLARFWHPPSGLVFSPDGKRLAASVDEKSIGIWNVESGKQAGLFQLPEDVFLKTLSFSPDNRMLALTVEGDGVMAVEIASNQIRWESGNKVKVANPFANLAGMMPPGLGGAMPIVSSYEPIFTNLVFSPDGKILSHGRSDQRIIFWETASGREIGLVKAYQGDITSLAFSPNGKQLASGGSDTTAILWDLTKILSLPETVVSNLSEKETEVRWADLAGDNAAKAYQAISHLSALPDSTVKFLQKHLKPTQPVAAGRIDKLITDLDDQQFEVRQKASAELERLGELTVPAARKILQGKPTAETRRRLEQLLSDVDSRIYLAGDRLQTLRAIEVLERIGSADARQLLQKLANGGSGSLQTEQAIESLKRLGQKEIPKDKGK